MNDNEVFVSLDTLGQGAAVEMFNEELKKVLENILDVNTKATTTRAVTLTVTIKPDENRNYSNAVIEAKSKVAPVKGVGLPIYVGRHGGQAVATERDTRQLEFKDNIQPIAAKGGSKK